MLARISVTSRACRTTSPSSLPRTYLIGWPAVCCGVVLPVCPCVVSFSKVYEHHTHNLLRTSSRRCHEDATRKLRPWNLSLVQRPIPIVLSSRIREPVSLRSLSRLLYIIVDTSTYRPIAYVEYVICPIHQMSLDQGRLTPHYGWEINPHVS